MADKESFRPLLYQVYFKLKSIIFWNKCKGHVILRGLWLIGVNWWRGSRNFENRYEIFYSCYVLLEMPILLDRSITKKIDAYIILQIFYHGYYNPRYSKQIYFTVFHLPT